MAKLDMTEASAGGDMAVVERPPLATDHNDQGAEAQKLRTRPLAKAPPTVPDAPAISLTAMIGIGAALRTRRHPSLRTLLMAAGIFAVVIGSATVWLRGERYASTDDALIQAARLLVTTDVSGLVSSVDVREGQAVKAGDLLFQIDPLAFQIAFDNANANLHETALMVESTKADYKVTLSDVDAQQAQVALDQVTFDRQASLLPSNTVSQAVYDQARYTLQLDKSKLVSLQQQAQVQLAKLDGNPDIAVNEHPLYRQAKAQVDEAQRQLNHASVRAPFSGVVTQVDALQPGTFLVAQTAALTETGAVALVSDDRIWVTAQMKETDLSYVKPGNRVKISVDTYPGQTWSGVVQAISPASSSEFSVLPPENTSGNWVKVVQRIPVRIGIEQKPDAQILRSGMSVYVDIDTGHRRTLSDLF
jgi:membrane fusion protein (multidrug efflux system)